MRSEHAWHACYIVGRNERLRCESSSLVQKIVHEVEAAQMYGTSVVWSSELKVEVDEVQSKQERKTRGDEGAHLKILFPPSYDFFTCYHVVN